MTYVIDTAGNISSVTTEVNGVETDTVAYTYGNAYWSDRLTAITVNGTSKNISYGITLLDAEGTEYYFSSDSFRGNQSEILKTMLQIKAFFFPESIEIKGVDQLENVIDFYKLSSEESAMLLELFG